jgi:hypothetical protein
LGCPTSQSDRIKICRISTSNARITPPCRGGNLGYKRLPRVSPWAIFISSLREEVPC